MGLTLITGRANAGKTGVLYQRLMDVDAAEPVLLLPQSPDVRRAQGEFAARGVMGVRIAVLDDWIAELWGLLGDGRQLVGPAVRHAVLERVTREAQLGELAVSASRPGFVRLLSELARTVTQPRPDARDSIGNELAQLLERYAAELTRHGLVEHAVVATTLAADLPSLGGPVAVNRFTDLSHAQEVFITALARKTEVLLSLPWQEGATSTEAATPLVSRLLDAGAEHVVVHDSGWTDAELMLLESRLFEEEKSPARASGAVVFGEASGVEAEYALTARIVREALEGGCAHSDIAVAFRDAATRVHMLVPALRAQGVEAVVDVSTAFVRSSFGEAFLSLVTACQRGGATRERMAAFLMSPYCRATADEVASLDRVWRERRTRGDDLIASVRSAIPSAWSAVSRARDLSARALDAESAAEWKLLADELLVASHFGRGLEDSDALYDAAAHGMVLRVANELALLSGRASVSSLVSALQSAVISSGVHEDAGRVLVTEAHRLKGRRYGMVVLGGLNADEFGPPRDDSLVDALSRRLGERGRADATLGERMLFYMMATRARERLILIRRTSSEQGEPTRASAFWEEVLDVYRTPEATAAGAMPPDIEAQRLSGADLVASAPALLPQRRRLRESASTAAPVPPTRGALSDDAAKVLADRDEFSVTEIELYLACPYAWFLRHIVRAREIDVEFGARERGSRAHEMLARFYSEWRAQGRERVCADSLDEAFGLLDRIASDCDASPRRMTAHGLEDELSAAKARAWARNVIMDDAGFLPGFAPAHHELRFGGRQGVPVELGGIALRGSIDRVDVGDAGLVVTDYKSSSTIHGHKAFGDRGIIQAPTYAAIASRLLELPVLGGGYRSMRTLSWRGFWNSEHVDPGSRGSGGDAADAAGIEAITQQAVERVQAAARDMRAGRIAPDPHSALVCGRCEARMVCGAAL